MSSLTTTPEQQVFAGNAVQAEAAFEAARQQVAQAEINLKRTAVRSPVNGFVTNLLLRAGDYARQGVTNVSIIDTDSFWIDGYFEETKMAGVCTEARVEAKLMGYSAPIIGHALRLALAVRGWFVIPAAEDLHRNRHSSLDGSSSRGSAHLYICGSHAKLVRCATPSPVPGPLWAV